MRRRLAIVALVAVLAATGVRAETIKIACEFALCKPAAEAWAASRGHEVQVVTTVGDSNERLAFTRQLLESGSDKVDVVQMDIVWPALLAPHLIDLLPYSRGAEARHLRQFVANNTVDARLVAMPWFADVGVLYYRKDLLEKYRLEPPRTWDELAAAATRVQAAERAAGNRKQWGYVWQGRAYEGLTCNALEWIAGEGGALVGATGKVDVNSAATLRALERAAGWVGTISPRAVLDFAEDESRGVFEAGNAVFMRHWPYAWGLLEREGSPVKGKVGLVPMPAASLAGPSTPMLGGWQLGVSAHSKLPALSAELVMHLTGVELQKHRAVEHVIQPTIRALYDDAQVTRALPLPDGIMGVMATAVTRPSAVTGARYPQVSEAFWSAVHDVLAGRRSAEEATASLEKSLQALKGGDAWR